MSKVFEVKAEDIGRLNEHQLTDLLRRLLLLEARSHGIPSSSVTVSMNISAPDGGRDGQIAWTGGPDKTDWIPSRLSLFQVKATKMLQAKCKNEVLCKKHNKSELKPYISKVLVGSGTYILFCNRNHDDKLQINGFREGIKAAAGEELASNADIRVYGPDLIANWANEYLPAIIAIMRDIGRSCPGGMQTWDMWSGYPENCSHGYVPDEWLKGHIGSLRDCFGQPQNVARIVGLSGLGKSRLAFEALRPIISRGDATRHDLKSAELAQQLLSDRTIYICQPRQDLRDWMIEWRELEALLVVDECEIELHNELMSEVEHQKSRFSLLTLDYDPECEGAGYSVIKLDKASDAVVGGIVSQYYPQMPESKKSHIVKMADGFPKMAMWLAKAWSPGMLEPLRLNDPGLMRKILWGRSNPVPEAEEVVRVCSLFEQLGFDEPYVGERKYAAEKICRIDSDEFYKHAQTFIKRGILQKRDGFVSVTPLPLALSLAEDWLTTCSPERRQQVLMDDMPPGMSDAMVDRFAKLDYLADARCVVEELCKDGGPFGQAEVLNTARGSRIFRSLVEVNPIAAACGLEDAFGDASREELLEVGPGRRNLVWALEKLCFWEETFPVAARLMLSLAAAENETWGNNATGQFLQLFHLCLSGTQAAPKARLNVIDDALNSAVFEKRALAIKALGKALKTHSFSRMGGVEQQGSRMPQSDWQPKTPGDIYGYFHEAVERLVSVACTDDELSALAREQLSKSIYSLVKYARLDDLRHSVSAVTEARGPLWPEALESVQHCLGRFDADTSSDVKACLEECRAMLQPKTIPDRLRLLVSTPPWEDLKQEDGQYVDVAAQKARELAAELAPIFSAWKQHLVTIMKGEQTAGCVFGYTLGKSLRKEPGLFLQEALSTLSAAGNEGNPNVLGGFLAALSEYDREQCSALLDTMADDATVARHVIRLTTFLKPTLSDLQRAERTVASGYSEALALRSFGYGRVLDHLSPPEVCSFCNGIMSRGCDGAWAALHMLWMYCYQDEERWGFCRDQFRQIILSPDLAPQGARGNFDDHCWSEVVGRLLGAQDGDPEIAGAIVGIALRQANSSASYDWENAVHEALIVALSRYKEDVWPILGDALLSADGSGSYGLYFILSRDLPSSGESSVVDGMSPEYLMNWCKEHGATAAEKVAIITPMFQLTDGELVLHPVAAALLDNYGASKAVLLHLESNLPVVLESTDESCGRIEKEIGILQQLNEHSQPSVRKWASRKIADLLKEKEYNKKLDIRDRLGR